MLKAEVPSAILKSALGDMSMDGHSDSFCISDDDMDEKEQFAKKKDADLKDRYAGSLVFKAGKSDSTSIYYVDHNKVTEMDSDERQALASNAATSKNDHDHLTMTLKHTNAKTKQLLSEPTNDDLEDLLSRLEKDVSTVMEKVTEAKALTVNEGQKINLKRRIQSMAGVYRKRRKLCYDILTSLEEVSDGVISMKQSLKGDGPIMLDSDESVNKSAITYAKEKHSRGKKKGFTIIRIF